MPFEGDKRAGEATAPEDEVGPDERSPLPRPRAPLYLLGWSPEIEKKLASGAAGLMLDRSGLLLAVTRAPRALAGLPRLVATPDTPMGRLVAALAGSANLVAAGSDVLQDKRAQRLARGSRTDTDTARDLLIEGCAVELGGRRGVDAARQRGESRLDPLAKRLALGTLEVLALLSHARDVGTVGFASATLASDAARVTPRPDLDQLRRGVREACESIVDVGLRKAAYQLADAQDAMLRLDRSKDAAAPLRASLHALANGALPVLRAEASARKNPGEQGGIALLLVEVMRTTAFAKALLDEPAAASAAFQAGGMAARDQARRLLDAEGSAFEFLATRLPAAKVLVAALHAMRIGEVALQPEVHAAVAMPIEPAAAARRSRVLSSDVFASPLDPGPVDGPRSRHHWASASFELTSRIAWAKVAEVEHEMELTSLVRWTGLPDPFAPADGFTEQELAAIAPMLLRAADPVTRSVETMRVLDAIGSPFVTEEERAQFREGAARWLAGAHGLEVDAHELSSLEDRTLFTLEESRRLTELARASSGQLAPGIVERESPVERTARIELEQAHQVLVERTLERDRAAGLAERALAALSATQKRIEATGFALGIREKDRETRELLQQLADFVADERKKLG
jgi:hypothetical protein